MNWNDWSNAVDVYLVGKYLPFDFMISWFCIEMMMEKWEKDIDWKTASGEIEAFYFSHLHLPK